MQGCARGAIFPLASLRVGLVAGPTGTNSGDVATRGALPAEPGPRCAMLHEGPQAAEVWTSGSGGSVWERALRRTERPKAGHFCFSQRSEIGFGAARALLVSACPWRAQSTGPTVY